MPQRDTVTKPTRLPSATTAKMSSGYVAPSPFARSADLTGPNPFARASYDDSTRLTGREQTVGYLL